jgi:hypothetical protein
MVKYHDFWLVGVKNEAKLIFNNTIMFESVGAEGGI